PSTPAGFGGQLGYYRDQRERLYVRARHYRPGRGRWMSRDPLGRVFRDRIMQLYGAGNPVADTDPSGLLRPSEFGAWSEERKAEWLADLRRRYGKLVCEAARRHCVPGELVIGMIVNEQIDYSPAERFAESIGFGNSVGLAQITIGTAVRYGLTDCKLSDYEDRTMAGRGVVIVLTAEEQYRQCVRTTLISDPGNIEATARLVATYLDGLCERARNRDRGVEPMLSDSFLKVAASCETADFCCRKEAAKRGDCAEAGERIAKLNTRSCLLAAMAVAWNNGIKTAENPNIEKTAENAWNHGNNADLFISDRLDGFCA
ncbi:MAG: hypothetical protein IT204_07300, partial [Fimbriimonadaceae bacterium]|nr:hypothetical protein [Fimbriimonadaceae bacterium]